MAIKCLLRWVLILSLLTLAGCNCNPVIPTPTPPTPQPTPTLAVGSSVYSPNDEILERRTETSKIYWLGGNQYKGVCSVGATHYKDPAGAWQNIDVTATQADFENFTAKFTKLPYLVRIGNDSFRRIYPDRNDLTYWIDIGKPFSNMGTPTKQSNKWTWNFTNAAISVTLARQSVKFDALLKNSSAPTSLTLPFDTVGITRQGSDLYHAGKVVAQLRKPSAVDANGVERDVAASFGSGSLTITLDPTGLTYPINIDPTLDIQPSGKDTYLRKNAATTNYGTSANMTLYDSTAFIRRSILEFVISAIPPGQTLTAATLGVYYYADFNYDVGGRTVWAYKLTQTDWVETEATWNAYKTSSNWTAAGGDYATSSPSGNSTVIPDSYGWMSWSILDICQDAYASSIPVELLLRYETESTANPGGPWWYTNNYAGDTSLCPKLSIDYESAGVSAPTVTSISSSIWATNATCTGNITAGDNATSRFIQYGYATTSYTANVTESGNFANGTFSESLSGLKTDYIIYWRAGAANSGGTGYGSELTFRVWTAAQLLAGD